MMREPEWDINIISNEIKDFCDPTYVNTLEFAAAFIGGNGVVLLGVWWLFQTVIKPRVEAAVKHDYAAQTETIKSELAAGLEKLKGEITAEAEKTKLKHALILQRSAEASLAIRELADYCYEIQGGALPEASRKVTGLETYSGIIERGQRLRCLNTTLLRDYWPEWRSEFKRRRSRLEATNEVLSRYTVQMETLLSAPTVRELIDPSRLVATAQRATPSDLRYIHGAIWRLVGDCPVSIGRIVAYDDRF